MTTLNQLLAERERVIAPPVSGRGVTLNDLLKEKASKDQGIDLSSVQPAQQTQPGPISQAGEVAADILNLGGIGSAIAKPFQSAAEYFSPQPPVPIQPDAGIGSQLNAVRQNMPAMTRGFNQAVTPGADVSGIQGFPGAGMVRGATELMQRPIVGLPGRAVGRGVTGFLDLFNLGGGAGVSGFQQGETSGIPKAVAESKLLDPYQPEAYNEFARNPLAMGGRAALKTGGFAAQAAAPLFGAADPAVQEAARAGKPIPKPDIGASIKQGYTKDFPEFIRQSLIRLQKKQRGEEAPVGEENIKKAEAFLPPLIEQLKSEGRTPEQIQREVRRQLFNVGFGGDVGETVGEIVAFEASLAPVRAVSGGLKAFGAARRAKDVASKTKLAEEALAKSAAENVPKPTVSGASTVAEQAPAVIKGAQVEQTTAGGVKKAVEKGAEVIVGKGKTAAKPKPKTVKGKTKVNKVLTQRATNIEKRVTAAGGDQATSDIIGKARAALEGGKVKEAESLLKTAIDNTNKLESSVKGKPFKTKTPVVEKPVTKKDTDIASIKKTIEDANVEAGDINKAIEAARIPESKPGGPLRTGVLRSRIENLRKAGASPVQLDRAEAMLQENLVKADDLITKAEQALKTPPEFKPAKPAGSPFKKKPAAKPEAPKKPKKPADVANFGATSGKTGPGDLVYLINKDLPKGVKKGSVVKLPTGKNPNQTGTVVGRDAKGHWLARIPGKKTDAASEALLKKVKAAKKKKGLGKKGEARVFDGTKEQEGVDPNSIAVQIYNSERASDIAYTKKMGSELESVVHRISKKPTDSGVRFPDGTFLSVKEGHHTSVLDSKLLTQAQKNQLVRKGGYGTYEIFEESRTSLKNLSTLIDDDLQKGFRGFSLDITDGTNGLIKGSIEFSKTQYFDEGLESLIKQAKYETTIPGRLAGPGPKRSIFGKKGEARLTPGGEKEQTPKGKEILDRLKALAAEKASRPKAFGPSKSQLEASERSLRQLKDNIAASDLSAADYIKANGGTANDVNRLIPQIKALKDIEPFAGKQKFTLKEILAGKNKKKVSIEAFGEKIVTPFDDPALSAAQKKGLAGTTKLMREKAMEDIVAARGLGTGGDIPLKSAIRKIKAGDAILDNAIQSKSDIPTAMMKARKLYGSALNDAHASAAVRGPLPTPGKGSPLPTPKSKAILKAEREAQISSLKEAAANRKVIQKEFDDELARLQQRLGEMKTPSAKKKIQRKIDKIKQLHPVKLARAGGINVASDVPTGRLKVKPAIRKTGIFGKKLKSETVLEGLRAAPKSSPPLVASTPKGFAQAPGKPTTRPFKTKDRPKARPFSAGSKGEAERRAAMLERRETGKKFIKERIEDREGLYGTEVERLLRQPNNARRLDKMMTQLKKAKNAGDAERVDVMKQAIAKLRGELQGQVKKQAITLRIRTLNKKMSDAFRRGNMTHYKNASEELERYIVKPKMKEIYLEESKKLYDQSFSEQSFRQLRANIIDDPEAGFARFWNSKELKDVDAKAYAAAAEEALTKSIKELASQAKGKGQSLQDFLVKTQRMDPKQARSLVREANRVFKKSDELMDIGSINVERLQRQGTLTKKQAKIMEEVNVLSEEMMKKVPLTRGQVKATSGSPNVKRLNELLWNYTDAELAAIPDQLFAQMQGTLNEMVNSGASVSDSILAIRPMLQQVSRSQSLAGRWLQGLKEPANATELVSSLKRMRKTTIDPVDKALIDAQLKMLEPLSETKRMLAWRAYQEFSVNNVLSAGRTQVRNVFGFGLEVMVRQPTDRITRAALTSVSKAIGVPMKNPAYWAEVLPEIRAIYGNIGKSALTGIRFFKAGGSQKLVDTTMAEIKSIRTQLLQYSKGSKEFKRLISRRDKLWNTVRDVVEINANARTKEVFTGQKSVLRELAARIENPILRGAADTVAKIVNIPVRALVSFDATFTEMSFKGHKAAMQVRKAIRKGMSVRDVGRLKFTAFERNQALQDSLYYGYRREWGKLAKFWGIDKGLRKPPFDNLFFFMRTRTNILKNYIDNSPFGFVNVINESVKAGGLDAKSFARWMNGSALHVSLYYWAKAKGGRFVGPSKDKSERDKRRARSVSELYYEDKDGNTHDMSNIAPVTPIIAAVAAFMEYEERKKGGQATNDNRLRAMDQMFKSIIEDAIYADVKFIQRMGERMMETSDDPTAYGSQALYTDLARFATGRGLPNILRETKQSGKILGIPIGLQPDMSVVEPTGNFAQTLEQQIASDLPGFTPKNLRVSPLTGKPVIRTKTYTPFNPKFWTEGIKPGSNIPANEDRVVKEMLRVKAGYSGPKGSVAKKYINIKLNNKEKRHMTRVISGAKYKGLNLLEALDSIVQNTGYKSLSNVQGGAVMQRSILQSTISTYTEIGYREAVKLAVDRLMSTEQGRKRLWFSAYQGNESHPYTGDIDHLKLLLRLNNIPIQ